MSNPYLGRPDHTFWKQAMSRDVSASNFDPITNPKFTLSRADQVATAGSCFAQHIARTLANSGFSYLITEREPLTDGALDENYGVFPARFGNVYTPRQLKQLFDRAYGIFWPADRAWTASRGNLLDPFRPRIQKNGFATLEALERDREAHLARVRTMFEECDVLIFTFGLTEGWESVDDGAVFPLAPGLVAHGVDLGKYRFHNFTVAEMEADMRSFIEKLRTINPKVRLILTVSPVALVATYENRHVLESTIYSKSALRVVADMISRTMEGVAYFPSYEIITGPQARASFFEPDLREVSAEGVAHVMSLFCRHYLTDGAEPVAPPLPPHPSKNALGASSQIELSMRMLQRVICEEIIIEESAA